MSIFETRLLAQNRGELIDPIVLPFEPPTPPDPSDYFYGLAGGIARYDARTLLLADGNPVLAWPDASGQVGGAENGGGNPPIYSDDGIPQVQFSSSGNTWMELPPELTRDPRDGFTIVVLAQHNNSAGLSYPISWGVGVSLDVNWAVGVQRTASFPRRIYIRLTGTSIHVSEPLAFPRDTPAILASSWEASEVNVYVDGGLVVGGEYPDEFTPYQGLGRISYYWPAPIHDILFFDRALTPAEIATVSNGLTADWGI